MALSAATTVSRRAWYSRRFVAIVSCGPVSAATAAAWATELGPEVLCDWSLTIALISAAGPAP